MTLNLTFRIPHSPFRAGGFSYRAEQGQVSVRYANGEVRTRHKTFLFASDPQPGPGSEVFVPVKDLTHRTDYVALVPFQLSPPRPVRLLRTTIPLEGR